MRSDINVTPLVDVCLVLLIIFMVVSEKLVRGMDVPLPQTRNHESAGDNERPVVSVTRGHIYWDREVLAGPADLEKRAAEEVRRIRQPIYVKASADLSYGEILPVLVALREAGSPGVRLGTLERKEN